MAKESQWMGHRSVEDSEARNLPTPRQFEKAFRRAAIEFARRAIEEAKITFAVVRQKADQLKTDQPVEVLKTIPANWNAAALYCVQKAAQFRSEGYETALRDELTAIRSLERGKDFAIYDRCLRAHSFLIPGETGVSYVEVFKYLPPAHLRSMGLKLENFTKQ